jgi:ABC-type uncharacterized transport system permease subunit
MTFLGIMVAIAVFLTIAMFATKNPLLGFPSGIFWALSAAQLYQMWADTGEIIYNVAFIACGIGMVVFTIMAAFSLREKRDTIADEEIEEGDGEFIDEESAATKRLHQRADKRRNKVAGDEE